MLVYKPELHKYVDLREDPLPWVSVSALINSVKPPFDREAAAKKASKKRGGKWNKVPVEEILAVWENENKKGSTLGKYYHKQREMDISGISTIGRQGQDIPIVRCQYHEGKKVAPEQKLQQGMYPEHFVYLNSAHLCGEPDLVEVIGDRVDILDWKTNKELKTNGHVSWDGTVDRMLPPVAHLDNCHISHYNLQLSLYMYMILRHNPRLKPGNLILQHVSFEEESKDKYGNPIYKMNPQGDPIVEKVTPYELPYLKDEVLALLEHLKNNREQIINHKH